MSIVKYGIKKYGRFKWGQPNKFYIYESLLEYLPIFITRNETCNGLIKAIAQILLEWQTQVYQIAEWYRTGIAGRRFANDWKIFPAPVTSDPEMEDLIANVYPIHNERGTEDGIVKDLKRLSGDANAAVEYYDYENCGWWIEKTFPDISTDGFANKYNTTNYIDIDNFFILKFRNLSGLRDKLLVKTTLRELIPVFLHTVCYIVIPLTLKWGGFKFGTKKYGQLVYQT